MHEAQYLEECVLGGLVEYRVFENDHSDVSQAVQANTSGVEMRWVGVNIECQRGSAAQLLLMQGRTSRHV